MSSMSINASFKDETDVEYSHLPTLENAAGPRVAKWGIRIIQPLLLTGGIIIAALIAVLHHVFDSYLEGKGVNGFWDQTMSRRAENAFATGFQIMLALSAGISLCQVVSTNEVCCPSLHVTDCDFSVLVHRTPCNPSN